MSSNHRKRLVAPEAREALNQMKTEIANEYGIPDYNYIDKGNLSPEQNSYVGGYIVKRLVDSKRGNMYKE